MFKYKYVHTHRHTVHSLCEYNYQLIMRGGKHDCNDVKLIMPHKAPRTTSRMCTRTYCMYIRTYVCTYVTKLCPYTLNCFNFRWRNRFWNGSLLVSNHHGYRSDPNVVYNDGSRRNSESKLSFVARTSGSGTLNTQKH